MMNFELRTNSKRYKFKDVDEAYDLWVLLSRLFDQYGKYKDVDEAYDLWVLLSRLFGQYGKPESQPVSHQSHNPVMHDIEMPTELNRNAWC